VNIKELRLALPLMFYSSYTDPLDASGCDRIAEDIDFAALEIEKRTP